MCARSTVYTISPSPDSTLAIETRTAGLVKQKHLFVFERFRGTLIYDPDQPLDSALHLTIEPASLACRDNGRNSNKRTRHLETALREALGSDTHPELQLESTRLVPKALRGFILEGTLRFRGLEHAVKANLGFGTEKKYRLQIDADAAVRLSDFGVRCPSSLFGLIRTEDEVVLHAYLWGVKANGGAGG
ncbi:MAG TPA: YceI family protein [Bryobacteraceae bacterium]|jgi:polyisoprenoid-binding protein YceI|nr:YceI family protein [Bryobacteraceae bacterium]